jgi:hypothetical protein
MESNMSRWLLAWFCVAICSNTLTAAEPASKYALLIGVAKYDHSSMNKPEPLKYPEADAQALSELLKAGGYQVDLLLGKAATQAAIREKLKLLKNQGNADGVVLIGVFGHGIETETSGPQNTVIKENYFCPFDTSVQLVTDNQGKPVFGNDRQQLIEPDPASLIKLSELLSTLKVAKAGHRVVLADCCRTVPNQARGRSFGTGYLANDLPDNTTVLFGCSPNEKAFEHSDWGHGAFTKCLLDELPKLAETGTTDTAILGGILKQSVPKLVATVAPRDRQTPKLFLTDSVDLRLSIKRIAKVPQDTEIKLVRPIIDDQRISLINQKIRNEVIQEIDNVRSIAKNDPVRARVMLVNILTGVDFNAELTSATRSELTDMLSKEIRRIDSP